MIEGRVSVVIPAYNLKDYLSRSVSSALTQDYKNVEVIVVDDGSTDGTASVADSLAAEDSRVRVIHTKNQGVAKSRHTGILAADGAYITFLDADDELSAGCLSTAMPYLSQGYDMVLFDYVKVHSKYDSLVRSECPSEMSGLQYAENLLARRCCTFALWAKVFRRSLFDNVDYIDLSYAEDFYVNIGAALRKPRVRYLKTPGYRYTIRPGSLSRIRMSLDFVRNYCRTVDCLLNANNDKIDGMAEELSSLLRLSYYSMYISCGRNRWVGDSDVAGMVNESYEKNRAFARKYMSHYRLAMLSLDRYKRMRWFVKLMATFRRWYVSGMARLSMTFQF